MAPHPVFPAKGKPDSPPRLKLVPYTSTNSSSNLREKNGRSVVSSALILNPQTLCGHKHILAPIFFKYPSQQQHVFFYQQKGTHQHRVLNLGRSTSSRVSICERQLDAVEIFEHQHNHQIKSNTAVREPFFAEQHWMQRIVGQERWGGGWPSSMGISG